MNLCAFFVCDIIFTSYWSMVKKRAIVVVVVVGGGGMSQLFCCFGPN